MPAIGHVTKQKDGSYKGQLKTLSFRAPIDILPNALKSGNQPDFRLVSSGIDIGAAWVRKGRNSGENYVSLSLCDPALGSKKLFANLGPAAGQDDPNVFAVIWNPSD